MSIKTLRFSLILVFLFSFSASLVSADSYTHHMKYDLKRGATNILSSPGEILLGFQDYHERAGWPFFRQGVGMLVGGGKMILRLGSGLVDVPCAFIPGLQRGLPVNPETLF